MTGTADHADTGPGPTTAGTATNDSSQTTKDLTLVDVESDPPSLHPPQSPYASSHPDDAGAAAAAAAVDDHDGDLITTAEVQHLKRGLAERHLTMLGIAGAIGTGLFLSLGGAIQTGGPLGALLGYVLVGGIVCAVQFALGEVTALLPVRSPMTLSCLVPLPRPLILWSLVSKR